MTADEIEELRDIVADHVAVNPIIAPVFQRLERELAEARAREAAVRRARRLSTEEALI